MVTAGFPSLVTPQEYAIGLEKLIDYGKQYDREVDPDETGVLIFTHINENQKKADEIARAFLSDFPTMSAEPLIARSAIGPGRDVYGESPGIY